MTLRFILILFYHLSIISNKTLKNVKDFNMKSAVVIFQYHVTNIPSVFPLPWLGLQILSVIQSFQTLPSHLLLAHVVCLSV